MKARTAAFDMETLMAALLFIFEVFGRWRTRL